MVQSIHASTPARIGAPDRAGSNPIPVNRFGPWAANTRHTASWSSLRMLTQKAPASRTRGHVDDRVAMQTATKGGSSETDVNELTARPRGSPPTEAVTTVTPVAKWPSTWR